MAYQSGNYRERDGTFIYFFIILGVILQGERKPTARFCTIKTSEVLLKREMS
jgi:hypothetical protein